MRRPMARAKALEFAAGAADSDSSPDWRRFFSSSSRVLPTQPSSASSSAPSSVSASLRSATQPSRSPRRSVRSNLATISRARASWLDAGRDLAGGAPRRVVDARRGARRDLSVSLSPVATRAVAVDVDAAPPRPRPPASPPPRPRRARSEPYASALRRTPASDDDGGGGRSPPARDAALLESAPARERALFLLAARTSSSSSLPLESFSTAPPPGRLAIARGALHRMTPGRWRPARGRAAHHARAAIARHVCREKRIARALLHPRGPAEIIVRVFRELS